MAIVSIVLPLFGESFSGVHLTLCIVCPILVAGPITFVSQKNRARLRTANMELRSAHERLARAHAELAVAHSRLAEKARHDEMTGMLNRESFYASVEAALPTMNSGALLLVDADRFKQINDQHGHLVGDEALRTISKAIDRATGEDALRGRIGGEEFAIFLSGVGIERAGDTAERIRRTVDEARCEGVDGDPLPLSVSIGVTMHRPGSDLSELIRTADERLYAAKRAGRNRIVSEDGIASAA